MDSTSPAVPAVAARPRVGTSRLSPKMWMWLLMGVAAAFVFVTTEVVMVFQLYPLYHGYWLQLIADRMLLIPHAVFAGTALLLGPVLFSSRVRQRYTRLHRVLGRVYVGSVCAGMIMAFLISSHGPLFPATVTQGGAWMLCALIALVAAVRRRIEVHRRWMVRSYAIGFTFVTLRVLDPWPRYWNMSDKGSLLTIIIVTFASFVVADFGLDWRELTAPAATPVRKG